MAFAPDGRLLALARSTLEVQLFDPHSSRQVARLPSPSPQIISCLCFSPDSSRLAVATEAGTVELWDLRRIRQELAEMGLDWDLPPYPPAVPADETRPLTVLVDDGQTEN
jgi:WD40 repeat protein